MQMTKLTSYDTQQRTAIETHKWFLSERLGRDVGFRVAALDYVTNVRPHGADAAHMTEARRPFRLGDWFFGMLEKLALTRGFQNLAQAQVAARSASQDTWIGGAH